MSNILAFAEARGGTLRKVALETITAARQLADATGGEVHALLVGAPGIGAQSSQLAAHGADVVVVVEHAAFTYNNPEASAALAADRARAGNYRAILFAASATGRDLAPRVAAKLGVGIVSDVTELALTGDTLTATHPMYAGKMLATVGIIGTPAVVTLRPNRFTPVPNERAGRVEAMPPSGDPGASRVVVKELQQGGGAKLDLGDAPVIVAGGRGLKEARNFALVEELAAAFGNAAVGATRAVTDDGWRPHSDQIGQTGRLVSPDLYVAVGISGAIQHLAGMRTSKTIVAINRDKDAPIFKVADYGIVGDVLEVLPVLTAAVREARKGH